MDSDMDAEKQLVEEDEEASPMSIRTKGGRSKDFKISVTLGSSMMTN